MKNWGIFICPQHRKGWAPTCFTTPPVEPPPGQTPLNNSNDVQAPRLSYVANELVIPRKKYATVPQQCVNLSMCDYPAETIMLAEYTDYIQCLLDTSPTGGDAIKSHRPTNGVSMGGAVFDGEAYAGAPVIALTAAEARAAITAAESSSAMGKHHICYINPAAHNGGTNYTRRWPCQVAEAQATLDPNSFLWGKRAYLPWHARRPSLHRWPGGLVVSSPRRAWHDSQAQAPPGEWRLCAVCAVCSPNVQRYATPASFLTASRASREQPVGLNSRPT